MAALWISPIDIFLLRDGGKIEELLLRDDSGDLSASLVIDGGYRARS
jgi:hypothetical protein